MKSPSFENSSATSERGKREENVRDIQPISASEAARNKTAGGNAAFHNFNNDFAHISDVNERRRLALARIDSGSFSWYHVRTILIAGTGFLVDSYDIFAIGLVTSLIGIAYFGGEISSASDTTIKVATSVGTVVGQLGLGFLADVIGRKQLYGLELIVIIVATVAQALSSASPSVSIVGVITFWRILMGIGIGGDYPLSATITSEFATTRWRGLMMNSVFAMQGIGQLLAGLVLLFVTIGFRDQLSMAKTVDDCSTTPTCLVAADRMWRIMIGFGAIPGCIALYFRLTIPETPRYTFDVDQKAQRAESSFTESIKSADVPTLKEAGTLTEAEIVVTTAKDGLAKGTWAEFARHYRKWKHLKVLLGTSLSWFFLDIAFYGLGLNNTIILKSIGWSGGADVREIYHNTAVGNLILVLAGAVPGYWVSAFLIDTVGRKPIQMFGFFMLILLFCIIGFDYWNLSTGALITLYTLSQFFFNAGPNSTTFIVPGECFPTRYRSTSHGISAASGKVGAIVAQLVFGPLKSIGADSERAKTDPRWSAPWINHIMQIFALFMLCGLCTSFLIPETARKTLEELGGEMTGDPEAKPFWTERVLWRVKRLFKRS